MQTTLKKWAVAATLLALVTACDKDDDPASEDPTPTPSTPEVPAAIAGESENMEFVFANPGAPYQVGDQVLFTFATDGGLGIDTDPDANNGDELTLPPFTTVGTELVWEDSGNGYKYMLSFASDSSIREVNVLSLSNEYLGQFVPTSSIADGALAIIQAMNGTYPVTSVTKGTHSRMTVTIDASGSIDFDTGISFDTANYELVTDRLDVLNGIWVDMTPYPNEPYPRIELFVIPGTQQLTSIRYSPQYPNVGGVVEININ